MKKFLLFLALIACFGFSSFSYAAFPCKPYWVNNEAMVCVCTAAYCDTVDPVGKIKADEIILYTTTQSGERFQRKVLSFQQQKQKNLLTVEIDIEKKFQTILGFGGAFTDAAGEMITSLNPISQRNLLASYFSPSGIEYNLARVPIASTDFSTLVYSYDDVPNDFTLQNFALVKEDLDYKIPLIKQAMQLSQHPITFFATPWSAPGWLKDNNSMINGKLRGIPGDIYHKTYARYFSLFLDAYAKEGIHFSSVSVENEPTDNLGFFQSMVMTAKDELDFVKSDLGPELKKTHPEVNIMVLDDNVGFLPEWSNTIFSDGEVKKYISVVGIHWYFSPPNHNQILDKFHEQFPQITLLATEACNGMFIGPRLGSWENGIAYAHNILQDLQHWVGGWTDWNLALNKQGGPNWVKNFVDAPIIVDDDRDTFYKQPMYYILGHFSKFIPKDSVMISATVSDNKSLEIVAALTPENMISVVVLNPTSSEQEFYLHAKKGWIVGVIPAQAIQTYIYSN